MVAQPLVYNGVSHKRLLVEPSPMEAQISETGLHLPVHRLFKQGTILSVCEGSEFSVGDIVGYAYPEQGKSYSVFYDGKEFDAIFEQEVAQINGEPINMLIVEPYSETDLMPSGLLAPKTSDMVTQKAKVLAAYKGSPYEVGKTVEYRKSIGDNNLRQSIIYNNVISEIVFFKDIFRYKGVVGEYYGIVKIDLAAQYKKRANSDEGLAIPAAYRYMRYNLQYGEVVELGAKAAANYPEFTVGDTVIFHHVVEETNARLVSTEYSDKGFPIYEYRLLHLQARESFDREVFAVVKKGTAKQLNQPQVVPIGQNVLVKTHIHPFEKPDLGELSAPFDCSDVNDYGQLVTCLERKKQASAKAYQDAVKLIQYEMLTNTKAGEVIDAERHGLLTAKRAALDEVQKMNMFVLGRDVLVGVTVLSGDKGWAAVPYKHLYPINYKGTDYLIAIKDLIVFTINNANMELTLDTIEMKGDRILVKPEPKKKDELVMAPSQGTNSVTVTGTIVNTSTGDITAPEGTIVGYHYGNGSRFDIGGETYLIMSFLRDVLFTIQPNEQA